MIPDARACPTLSGVSKPIRHPDRTPGPWEPPINYLPFLVWVRPMRLARSAVVGAVMGAWRMRRSRASRIGVISCRASPTALAGEPSKQVRARIRGLPAVAQDGDQQPVVQRQGTAPQDAVPGALVVQADRRVVEELLLDCGQQVGEGA